MFFLQGVAEQAKDAVAWRARAKRLEDLRATWRERLIQARSSALVLALADALIAQPVITIPQAQKLLDVTYRSAQLNVSKLVDAGILRQVGSSSYGRTYVAEEILSIIPEHSA